jgi:hypothetical protein
MIIGMIKGLPTQHRMAKQAGESEDSRSDVIATRVMTVADSFQASVRMRQWMPRCAMRYRGRTCVSFQATFSTNS